ncbi:hypothetical protein HII36_33235 [Nonomuraea sp. NN258]|uniref:hypothetical protein n=1 Tax=Nonomuraea antri TaxID=2730852 RepID=UPI001569286E|nr:hypothetical protein [Nonomuraea antri]NRQ36663.1 hypothetical protein [Nonomuraea antri]
MKTWPSFCRKHAVGGGNGRRLSRDISGHYRHDHVALLCGYDSIVHSSLGEGQGMMATREQIDSARRRIEQLRDEHGDEVRALIRLIDYGAMKGPSADELRADLHGYDHFFQCVFACIITSLEGMRPDDRDGTS